MGYIIFFGLLFILANMLLSPYGRKVLLVMFLIVFIPIAAWVFYALTFHPFDKYNSNSVAAETAANAAYGETPKTPTDNIALSTNYDSHVTKYNSKSSNGEVQSRTNQIRSNSNNTDNDGVYGGVDASDDFKIGYSGNSNNTDDDGVYGGVDASDEFLPDRQ